MPPFIENLLFARSLGEKIVVQAFAFQLLHIVILPQSELNRELNSLL